MAKPTRVPIQTPTSDENELGQVQREADQELRRTRRTVRVASGLSLTVWLMLITWALLEPDLSGRVPIVFDALVATGAWATALLLVWYVSVTATRTLDRHMGRMRQLGEQLQVMATRDALTGVRNHAAFVDELRSELYGGTGASSHALALVDVDHLKAVNDTYGHQMGDAVLRSVAEALTRDGALVGRYGGDEFIAALRDTSREAAEEYRRAVLDDLARADLRDPETGAVVPVSASIGLAMYPEEAKTIHDLIALADSAMFSSRQRRGAGAGDVAAAGLLGGERAAEMVGEIVPLLTSHGDLSEKLRLVAYQLSVGAGYDGVNFALLTPEPGAPLAANTFARAPAELVDEWNRIQGADTGPHPMRLLLERARRPVVLDDPWNDENLLRAERDLLRAAELRSVLVAPMIWQDRVVGLLGVASKREAAFTPLDARFLATVAIQVTAIVQVTTLLDQIQSTSVRLAQARNETVMLLAASAEAHDSSTGNHLQGVRILSEALALELGYGEDDARQLGLAAVLHDIGKIRVPDSILARSGRLSSEEWELMKHHTTWGSEFLSGRPGLEQAAAIARSHHECWDGTGYPDGLSAEEIPEAAAIVAVADSFDAMTSDRPYRPRRSADDALQEIISHRGSQFCPRVVAALERLHRRQGLPLPLDGRHAA